MQHRFIKSALAVSYGFFSVFFFYHEHIPDNSEVQAGYIAPSKLEIDCEDLDGDDKLETVVKIDGNPFLLKYSSKGEPVLLPYESNLLLSN